MRHLPFGRLSHSDRLRVRTSQHPQRNGNGPRASIGDQGHILAVAIDLPEPPPRAVPLLPAEPASGGEAKSTLRLHRACRIQRRLTVEPRKVQITRSCWPAEFVPRRCAAVSCGVPTPAVASLISCNGHTSLGSVTHAVVPGSFIVCRPIVAPCVCYCCWRLAPDAVSSGLAIASR